MVSPERVWFDEDQMWVALSDGRSVRIQQGKLHLP